MKIILKNGRGQLGQLLKQKTKELDFENQIIVYHTWDIDDKSIDSQKKQYEKFKSFVLDNRDKKIIFISTSSQNETQYARYKQLSECFLIQNCKDCLVLKFPTLIGKGIFMDFKNSLKKPYGIMNIMTLENACNLVVKNLNYDGLLKIKSFEGHKIDAKMVYDMVRL